MKVVVTGGSGRIGQAVVRALLGRGDEVLVLDRRAPEDKTWDFVCVDITDFLQVVNNIKGADAVVHLAAIPSPWRDMPQEVMRVNGMGTYNVLEACRQLGIQKVVVASSINAVGLSYNRERPRLDYLPIDEKHPARPEDCYSLSKWLGEQMADAMVRLAPEMTIVSLRFHGVVSPEWYQRWREHPRRELPGDFKGLWGYVDIRDAVDAVLKALSVSWTGHEAFFICAADISWDVPTMELVRAVYPDVPLKRGLQDFEGLFDLSKARELLGWQPRFSWRCR